jgi:proteasome lid subunit RPN8/RPN11
MAKAANVKVRVSAQPVVVMESEVARKIRQHARTSMKAEVCGVLIGNTEHERMVVEACIPGVNAAQGGAHVTFTQDTWEHIYKIKDKDYPDSKIVGWYHSHPGFGVFLSEHDLFIQQNFFSNPQQVAWVYDPHTDEEGCFGWIGDKIEKLNAIRVGYTQNIEITPAGANAHEDQDSEMMQDSLFPPQRANAGGDPVWMRWLTSAIGYVSAILLGFVLCFLFLNWRWAPALEKARRYDDLVRQYLEDQRRQQSLAPPPATSASPQTQPTPALENQPPSAPPRKTPAKDNSGQH